MCITVHYTTLVLALVLALALVLVLALVLLLVLVLVLVSALDADGLLDLQLHAFVVQVHLFWRHPAQQGCLRGGE